MFFSTLEAKYRRDLEAVRQEVRNLIIMGMRPDISPEERALIRNLERSARAEAKLRKRALDQLLEEEGKSR